VKSELLRELSYLFQVEGDNVVGEPYAWPPVTPTAEQRAEQERLYGEAEKIRERAQKTERLEQRRERDRARRACRPR
jgi:hypothetical protein